MQCKDLVACLEQLSPKQYACDWDNVGLLVGRKEKDVKKVMIALDATKEVVNQAVQQQVDLLITHHPMIFSGLKRINEDNFVGEKVLTLAEAGICYYAMHTNFDVVGGMAELAAGENYLNLSQTSPIQQLEDTDAGLGRYGTLPYPMTGKDLCTYVKEKFNIPFVMLYESEEKAGKIYEKIAVLPGSGKSEKKAVLDNGYDLYLTGDFGHHDALDAVDMGITLIDATHYGLEHIFVVFMADYIKTHCSGLDVVAYDKGSPVQIV